MGSSITEKVLEEMEKLESVESLQLAAKLGVDHQEIVGCIRSIQSIDQNCISVKTKVVVELSLTDEGREVLRLGSHEFRLLGFFSDHSVKLTTEEVAALFPMANIGLNKAVDKKWLLLEKTSSGSTVVSKSPIAQVGDDRIVSILKSITENRVDNISDEDKKLVRKRKLVQEIKTSVHHLAKGPNFTTHIMRQQHATELTAEMVASGSWKNCTFKPYNLQALGQPLSCGHLHPLLKVRAEYRRIFLEMGFTEMPTNNFVESSFWNFDALFQPQHHPARDAHDTFFLSEPALSTKLPDDYVKRVQQIHSNGGYGSTGYNYKWERAEAEKLILRTHTTAVSARMLYEIGRRYQEQDQGEKFKPVRLFSMDRVFRNETLDATHLAEFHQIEGLVAERGLHLGHLLGLISEFFAKLGLTKLRFKPTYNPYTEPSMEVYSWHEGLKKWVELGNSGIFRPEVLRPMGLPYDVNVVAWGLGLERPTMIKYGITNIRDLVGNKVDLQVIYQNPICRL